MNLPLLLILSQYGRLVDSIVDDALEAVDVPQLQAAIKEFKDTNSTTTDEAQKGIAQMFDDSLDFEVALRDAGVPFDVIGQLLEHYDYNLFYWAIKLKVKGHSRKRQRNMRRFQQRLHAKLQTIFDQ